MKLLIGIPTINRADLLNDALGTYFEDFPNTQIFIVDNGKQNIISREKKQAVYCPLNNLGVSKSWNTIMDYAVKTKHTHVLMLNDDVILGKKEETVIAYVKNNSNADFFCTTKNWCSFILPVATWLKIGAFDEAIFPAYFEDNDYFYRMKLAGLNMQFTNFLDPIVYRNSMTIAKNPAINSNFENNRIYYMSKWGGQPNQERYTTPFNK